jgi:glycosyltransferase involved in cell wall biosynthesis
MPPLISIVMPVYNGALYLADALATVSSQTLTDWELIVVDDGSMDTTPDILKAAAADDRRRVIRQANAGLAAARNRGLAEAGAPHLAFLDVDDRWHPSYLAEMVSALDRTPASVAAFAGWRCIDDAGRPLPQQMLLSPEQTARLRADLCWRNAILPSAVVARRSSVLQAGGFDEQFEACEDWDLWLRLIALGDFISVPHILMDYRIHTGSMTEKVEHIEQERLKLNSKHVGPLAEPLSAWPAQRRRAVGYTYLNTALGYLRQKRMAPAQEKIRQAASTWPGLLRLDEFYYELGCAFQSRGVRGTAMDLSLPDGEALIRSVLFEWISPELTRAEQKRAWGQANMVLARLARAAGQPQAARQYAARAVRLGTIRHRWRGLRTWARSYWPG